MGVKVLISIATMYTLNDNFIKHNETISQLGNQKQNWTRCSLKQAGHHGSGYLQREPRRRSSDPPTTKAVDRGSLFPDWLNFTQGWPWLVAAQKTSSRRPLKGFSAGSAAVLPWLQHNWAFPRSVGTSAFSVHPELGCNCVVDNECWKLRNLCVVLLTAEELKRREYPPSRARRRLTPREAKLTRYACSSLDW